MRAHSDTGGSGDAGDYLDMLRLNESDRQALLALIPQPDRRTPTGKESGATTVAPHLSRIGVEMTHASGFAGRFAVYTVGITRTGISFLHGSYVHAGTSCVLRVRTAGGESVALCGTVAGCSLVRGRAHVVEAMFVNVIDPAILTAVTNPTQGAVGRRDQASASESRGGADRAAVLAMAGEINRLVDALDALDAVKASARALAKNALRDAA